MVCTILKSDQHSRKAVDRTAGGLLGLISVYNCFLIFTPSCLQILLRVRHQRIFSRKGWQFCIIPSKDIIMASLLSKFLTESELPNSIESRGIQRCLHRYRHLWAEAAFKRLASARASVEKMRPRMSQSCSICSNLEEGIRPRMSKFYLLLVR